MSTSAEAGVALRSMIRRIVELSGPLAVDQKTREGATLRLAQELSDPVGSLEVGHEDVEQLDTGDRGRYFHAG